MPLACPAPCGTGSKEGARAQALRRAEKSLGLPENKQDFAPHLRPAAPCRLRLVSGRTAGPPASRSTNPQQGLPVPGGFLAVPSTVWGRDRVSQTLETCVTAPTATPARPEPCTWQEPRGTRRAGDSTPEGP